MSAIFPFQGRVGEIVVERKHGGRAGLYEKPKSVAFLRNMSEFSQISRLQEENRKVKMFSEAPVTPISFFFLSYFPISIFIGFAGTPGASSHVVSLHFLFVSFCVSCVDSVFSVELGALFLFSEKFKQDYEKLEELLKTLPHKTSHEVMVSVIMSSLD